MNHADPSGQYGRIAESGFVSKWQRSRFTDIGLGSMGNPVAVQLARHGVGTGHDGRIRLIDGDAVENRNLIGTDYSTKHVGMPKAQATGELLREINPQVNLTIWPKKLDLNDLSELEEMAGQSDLLCDFADDFPLMHELSRRCYRLCPMVAAIFGPRCDFAEVAFSVPGRTAPLHITLGRRGRQTINRPQALGVDTLFVASFVAALCLRLLAGERGAEILKCYANAPLFLVGLRPVWIFANQPADVARSIVHVGIQQHTRTFNQRR